MVYGEITLTSHCVGSPWPLSSVSKWPRTTRKSVSEQPIISHKITVDHSKVVKPWTTNESPGKAIKVWRQLGLAVYHHHGLIIQLGWKNPSKIFCGSDWKQFFPQLLWEQITTKVESKPPKCFRKKYLVLNYFSNEVYISLFCWY